MGIIYTPLHFWPSFRDVRGLFAPRLPSFRVVRGLSRIAPEKLDERLFDVMFRRLSHPKHPYATSAAEALSYWRGLSQSACETLCEEAQSLGLFRQHLFLPMVSCSSEKIRRFLWSILRKPSGETDAALRALLADAEANPSRFEALLRWATNQPEAPRFHRLLESMGRVCASEPLGMIERRVGSLVKDEWPSWHLLWYLARLRSPLVVEVMLRQYTHEPRLWMGRDIGFRQPTWVNAATVLEEMGYASDTLAGRIESIRQSMPSSSEEALRLRYALFSMSASTPSSEHKLTTAEMYLLLFLNEQKARHATHDFSYFLHLNTLQHLFNGFLDTSDSWSSVSSEIWSVIWQRMRNHLRCLPCDRGLVSRLSLMDALCERLINLPQKTWRDLATHLQETLYQ